MSYPFSAKLVAIRAPNPDAPPVISTVLSLKIERSKCLDRSATSVMMAFNCRIEADGTARLSWIYVNYRKWQGVSASPTSGTLKRHWAQNFPWKTLISVICQIRPSPRSQ